MSARDACSVIVAGEKKSTVLSSFKGNPGTFSIPAYRTGGEPPTAWVISAVCNWLGSVLRSVQESPPSFETKMGAVALVEPPGLGVKAEAARSCGLDTYNARNGSASCQVSPLSETGIKSTTRTPASLPGGACGTGASQATHRATATAIRLVRMKYNIRSVSAGPEPLHPPAHGEHLCLPGKHLLREHPVHLRVAIETRVGEHHEAVVAVGGLAQRRAHDPTGGAPGEDEGVDIGRAQHDVEIAAAERADPTLGDENVAGSRCDVGVDRRGGIALAEAGGLCQRGKALVARADLGIAGSEPHRHVDDPDLRRARGVDGPTQPREVTAIPRVAVHDARLDVHHEQGAGAHGYSPISAAASSRGAPVARNNSTRGSAIANSSITRAKTWLYDSTTAWRVTSPLRRSSARRRAV